jgi:predicted regulator of Ras-like GTPase activity (Roadblock/LC7/MglB family)
VIEVIEPLSRVPGVRSAALVSSDGVPVVVKGRCAHAEAAPESTEENADALAGLASSWLAGLKSAVAPLSWETPRRVVLRAARGTLVLLHADAAVLLVLLDTGASPDELRLPMEAAVARLKRVLSRARAEPIQAAPALPASHRAPAAQVTPVETAPHVARRDLSH